MRLLTTDEGYEIRPFKSSPKCSVFAINHKQGDSRNQRFLGIAPTVADAKRCVEYLYKAHDALRLAEYIVRP